MSNEVEYKGIKVKGGKLLLIFPLLGTIGGAIWAGFEGYARWVAMEDKIANYTAPDLSGFQKQLSDFNTTVNVTNEKIESLEIKIENEITNMNTLLQSEISTALELVQAAQGDARDIRNELRKDINQVMDAISNVDKRSRTTEQEIRGSQRTAENDVRTLIQHAEDRFDGKRTAIESDANRRNETIDVKLKELEDRIIKLLERALNNPLAGQ
jgi:uncharacterized protein YqgV (UPF0045/DUF77 family)|tara:strand:+ start:573 stop:1208 length:636 start_codon:yes stop_codon:yes gene_type:complete